MLKVIKIGKVYKSTNSAVIYKPFYVRGDRVYFEVTNIGGSFNPEVTSSWTIEYFLEYNELYEVPKKPRRYWLWDVWYGKLVRKSSIYIDENGVASDGGSYLEGCKLLKKHENEFIDVNEDGEAVYE